VHEALKTAASRQRFDAVRLQFGTVGSVGMHHCAALYLFKEIPMSTFQLIVGGYVLFVMFCAACIFVKEIVRGMAERDE
jgi:hypothetical protein